MKEYVTVAQKAQDDFFERKSQFIGAIAPVSTEEEALVLPVRQAAAIANSRAGTELILSYVDSGGERVDAAWLAG